MTADNTRHAEETRVLNATFAAGEVQLWYDIHWKTLSDRDREFLTGLIDAVSKLGGVR